ncbi:outer membrane protein assembly factor BamB family protein [Streptomyces sp. 4N509B]|uniref:outer membrane protein assembly factor BamB family protein n=1 Tax=Streptomyces sp. 4N509B TaxID=3457413 RepID=UPI003FCF2C44
MSQPPPPPNQPPGQPAGQPQPGGFGPPSPPPAPGTPPSAPPLPPAGQPGQPGYGYPQTQPGGPPQPPAAGQPPYGYPQQPPPPGAPAAPPPPGPPPGAPVPPPGASTAGFATPTGPGPYAPGAVTPPPGQPGWGQPPGHPGMPGMPPPGGPRRGMNTRLMVIVAAVTAVVLAAVGAVVLISGDDGSPTAEGERGEDGENGGGEQNPGGGGEGGGGLPTEAIDAALAWSVPGMEPTAEEIILGARGSWISGDTVVRTMDDAITAFSLEGGEEVWSVPLQLSGGDCNASPTASENRIAVLQGRDCEVLTVIDIAEGTEVTTINLDLDAIGGYLTDTTYPAILGDTVLVGWGTGGAGYSISEGAQIFEQSSEEDCPEVAYVVIDEMFVSHRQCGFLGDEGGAIRATNEAGDVQWEWEYGPEYENKELAVKSVVSIEPLVITAWLDDDLEQESILVVDDNHQEISHVLDYDIDRFKSPCQVNTFNDCRMSVVHDGFLYLAGADTGMPTSVVAFELSSGQPLYEVEPMTADGGAPPNGSALEIRPFTVLDGKVLAYQRDAYDPTQPGMVLAIDPATEEATPLMNLDPGASEEESYAGSPTDYFELGLLWHENSLLMLTEAFYEPDLEQREAILAFR